MIPKHLDACTGRFPATPRSARALRRYWRALAGYALIAGGALLGIALVDKIVLTTNNQNRISSRDLRANDAVQVDMERGFAIYELLYERKQRQHDSAAENPEQIVANEAVGQWYLAVVLKNPADGRGRKYKVWGEFYDKIFAGKQPIEPYVAAVLLGRRVAKWINASGLKRDADDVKRMLAKRGAFHVGRIAAFLWKGNDR